MKLSALVTFLPLLLSTSAVFAATGRDVIRARQALVKKDLVDVCVALDVDVHLGALGLDILAGHISLCLCLSVLPGFLGSNPVARTVVDHIGQDRAHDYFTNLIQSQQNKQQCHYPPHATPFCNIECPCDFTCCDGYTPYPSTNPTQCICKPPFTECNGVCGSFPHGCGSQAVSRRKREGSTCPTDKTMCGVPGRKRGIDCVDTLNNPESCGGCVTPLGNGPATGQNCNAIPYATGAICNGGTCQVTSCEPGFKPSSEGSICVRIPRNNVPRLRDVRVVDGGLNRRESARSLGRQA